MDVQAFLKLAPARQAPPVAVLAGDEPFFKDEALAAIERALGPHERADRRAGGAAARIAAELAGILDELRTGSLFSPVKLLVVREAEGALAGAGEAILAHAKRGAAAAKAGGPRACLVLDLGALDKRTKAARALEGADGVLVVECKALYADPPPWAKNPRPEDSPLVAWTLARARAAGLAARPDVAHYLTQVTGNDLREIAATFEKVKLSGAKELTPDQVEALAGRTRRDDALAVADALGKRDAPRILGLLARMFERGLEDRRGGRIGDAGAIGLIVFGRLQAKLGEIRRTIAHLERTGDRSRDAVAAAVGISPFIAERAVAEADRYRGFDFAEATRALLDADLAVKGAVPGGGSRLALERLVLTVLNPAGAEAKMPRTSRTV